MKPAFTRKAKIATAKQWLIRRQFRRNPRGHQQKTPAVGMPSLVIDRVQASRGLAILIAAFRHRAPGSEDGLSSDRREEPFFPQPLSKEGVRPALNSKTSPATTVWHTQLWLV